MVANHLTCFLKLSNKVLHIAPHQAPKPVDMNDLSARVTKLEEIMANVQQQSNIGTSKQSKKQRQQQQSSGSIDANESASDSTV